MTSRLHRMIFRKKFPELSSVPVARCTLACGQVVGEFVSRDFALAGTRSFTGFTRGEKWDGWECPRFTKEVGKQIIDCFNNGYYDEDIDAFVFTDPVNVFGPEIYPGGDIDVHGDIEHVYPIGAWFWNWESRA